MFPGCWWVVGDVFANLSPRPVAHANGHLWMLGSAQRALNGEIRLIPTGYTRERMGRLC